MSDWNIQIVDEFRGNDGIVGMFDGRVLLLHSTGAKSGQVRLNPLAYQAVGDSYAIFASKGGAPSNPDWYYNLLANPKASIEVGSETVEVIARIVDGDERKQIWSEQKERYPQYGDYEAATSRQIPVVVLDPA